MRSHFLIGLSLGIAIFSRVANADSSGTGFFVTQDGLVVTNFHVIEGANSITITRFNGKQSTATPVVLDRANDIAILQVDEASQETVLQVRHSSTANRGTDLLTIGFPLTSIQGKEPKVTSGILSSLSGLDDDPRHFQISVPVQPGNSGGPLIAKDGAVIGIVTSKLNAIGVVRATGDIPQNVNFAVKSAYLTELFSNRVIESRVKAIFKPGLNLSTEEIVRRSLNAVVLINAKTSTKPNSLPPTSSSPHPNDTAPIPSNLDFGNVKFSTNEGYLEVSDIAYNHLSARTTLRIGDRILGCMKGNEVYTGPTRVYTINDLEKCKLTTPVKSLSPQAPDIYQYMFRIVRLSRENVGSIIK